MTREHDSLQEKVDLLNEKLQETGHTPSKLDNTELLYQKLQKSKDRSTLLVKLGYKFIQSMRKVQRAVKKKDPAAQVLKQEFDIARVDFETALKQIKRATEAETEDDAKLTDTQVIRSQLMNYGKSVPTMS